MAKVASVQLPDGRIGQFEVPDDFTPEQAQAAAQAMFEQGELVVPAQEPDTLTENVLDVAGEFAAGANRTVVDLVDFLGPDTFNALMSVAGSDIRVPTLRENIPGIEGGFMEPGTARQAVRTAGETAALAAGTGAALRGGAQSLPAAAPGESVARGTLRQFGASTPAQDIATGALAGAGAEIGEEIGGETGRTVGSVVAPLSIPAGAAATSSIIKRAFRGGEAGRQTLSDALVDFGEIGVTPSIGQGTGDNLRQGVETIASRVLGGGPIVRALNKTQTAMQKRLGQIADDLSTVRGDVEAGRTIQRGITGKGGFVDRFLDRSGGLWRQFDDLIDDATQINATNTQRTLDDLISDTQVGQVLNNPLVGSIKDAIDDTGGNIDYRSLRQLRTAIGRRLGDKSLISDVPRAELKQLYGAISEDLRATAQQNGQQAVTALNRANTFTAAGHKRIDDFVERVVSKADLDKVFQAVARGGEGVQSINAIKRSLKPDEWEVVASNIVRRLGKANPGQQDNLAEVFSVSKFLSDWNRLGPAKKAIFSGSNKLNDYRANLDRIASAANRFKDDITAMANPSGTAQSLANLGAMVGGATALGTGNLPMFFTVLGAVGANNGAARLMTSDSFVKWLAQGASTKNWPSHMARLTAVLKTVDEQAREDVVDLVDTLRANSPGENPES